MWFTGYDYFGTVASVSPTPTNVASITYIELKNGWFDKLYVTEDTNYSLDSGIPVSWTYDTVMFADFENTTNAGNIDTNTYETKHLLIKRRELNDYNEWTDWMTIADKDINEEPDFAWDGTDFFNAAKRTYQYAAVPIFDSGLEGSYYKVQVDSDFDGIYVAGKDDDNEMEIWGTPITDAYVDTTRTIVTAYNILLRNRYPVAVSNSPANYDVGVVNGNWHPIENCEPVSEDGTRTTYQRLFMDFITNYKPKILKTKDGRIWLCTTNPSPTDTAQTEYNNRLISFEFTEIANYLSEEHLWRTGLSDVEERWWA